MKFLIGAYFPVFERSRVEAVTSRGGYQPGTELVFIFDFVEVLQKL
jgi:hypothetical protein